MPLLIDLFNSFAHAGASRFNGYPPLGVNATFLQSPNETLRDVANEFQWAPTLGGECYNMTVRELPAKVKQFQWAPTLGGECYLQQRRRAAGDRDEEFQWAPTLGGECYLVDKTTCVTCYGAFQWAPTLGGECYYSSVANCSRAAWFQWAPTLGGECYKSRAPLRRSSRLSVSMGTHPWG